MMRFSLASVVVCCHFVAGENVHHQTTALRRGSPAKVDLQAALSAVLGEGHDVHHGRMEEIGRAVTPSWRSLPVNEHGRVDKRSLRYSVHRYFMQHYSLSIIGLEPTHISSEHDEVLLLSQNLPLYVKNEMDGKAALAGFSLDDAVVMIATIERLIADSDHDLLEGSLAMLNKSATDKFSFQSAHELLEQFVLRWLVGDDQNLVRRVGTNQSLLQEFIDGWPDFSAFAKGQLRKFQHDQFIFKVRAPRDYWNPLKDEFSLADVDHVADSMTTSFGTYWTTECRQTKQLLIDMDRTNTGRVTLVDFYGAAMNGEWRFSESKDYLRQMGALDETSAWQGPKIIITNYIQASSNCAVVTPHYRVCCTNECEDIMTELEVAIGGPLATPAALLEVLAVHDSVDYTVRLSSSLKEQLVGIAQSSVGGLVPLHGRLFAQWLHYAFPHECAFPHKAGTTTALSPSEFGEGYVADEGEMKIIAETKPTVVNSTEQVQEEEWMVQWSHEEELLSEATLLHAPWEARQFPLTLLFGVTSAAVAAAVYTRGMKRSSNVLPMSASKSHYF